jgi:hypothetical protein
MLTKSKIALSLAFGLSVAAWASPGFAQRQEDHNSAREQAAIHECSVRAGRYSNTSELTTQFAVYNACMAEHGMNH